MKKLVLLVISIPSLISFGCVTMPEVKTTPEAIKSQNEALVPRQHKPPSRIVGGVNKEQPISIGEVIYSESVGAGAGVEVEWGVYEYQLQQSVSYSYMGLDDKNNVKIVYSYESGPGPIWREKSRISPKVETVGLLFPLNSKKQTMLKVKSFELDPDEWRSPIVSKKELIITVVDEFHRITVEEIGDTQAK